MSALHPTMAAALAPFAPKPPSDADIKSIAILGVANYFRISTNDALNRLAEIDDWLPVEIDDRERQRRAESVARFAEEGCPRRYARSEPAELDCRGRMENGL